VVDDASGVTVYTPEFDVPPGDSFTCINMDYKTAEELSVVGGDGKQGPGGHHIIVYYATDERTPGVHPCDDAEMVNLNQISGSAGDGGQVLTLPEGLAIKVPVGKQFVVQAHYINITGETEHVRDWAKIVKGDPAKINAYVNYFVTNDDGFQIPAASKYTRTSECTVDRDFQMAIVVPHMHELGEHFKLEVLDEQGVHVDTPVDTDWQPSYTSHPPIGVYPIDTPYLLKKGQKLRQSCSWDNTSANPTLFPREMCLTFFYYWPGDGDLDCTMVPTP